MEEAMLLSQELHQSCLSLELRLYSYSELQTLFVQKYKLFDCYIYFSISEPFPLDYISSVYANLFLQLFQNPELFESRVMNQLVLIQSVVKEQPNRPLLLPLTEIVDMVENINLRNHIYQDYFQNLDLEDAQGCSFPFWMYKFLINDLKLDSHECLQIYFDIYNKYFNNYKQSLTDSDDCKHFINVDSCNHFQDYDKCVYFIAEIISILLFFVKIRVQHKNTQTLMHEVSLQIKVNFF